MINAAISDVACKSYKGKSSNSSVTIIIFATFSLVTFEIMRKTEAFLGYKYLESNKHLKKNLGTKTIISYVNRIGVNTALKE